MMNILIIRDAMKSLYDGCKEAKVELERLHAIGVGYAKTAKVIDSLDSRILEAKPELDELDERADGMSEPKMHEVFSSNPDEPRELVERAVSQAELDDRDCEKYHRKVEGG